MTARGILFALATALSMTAAPRAQSPAAPTAFSPAVAAGDFVYLSGMLPTDASGEVVAGGVRAQTARALDNLGALLEKNGSSLTQVAALTVYLRNMGDFAATNEVSAKYWPKDPSTRATAVGSLVAADALVEISMIAVRDGRERKVVHPSAWLKPANPTIDTGLASPDARVEIMMTAVKSPSPQGAAVAKTAAAGSGDWRPLFDGKTLTGWKESQFTARGKVSIEDGQVVLGNGYMTGITWTGAFPTSNFEVRYQAQRRSGSDFFGALTFPVHDSYCTFINGGWGGSVVGLSSLDTMDASENDTTVTMGFTNGRWYSFRVRVTDGSIEAWINEERVVAVDIRGRRIGLRLGDIEYSAPLGIASYESVAAIRNIEYRVIDPTGNAKR
jgi:reactive intermediate/imine deaminase